MSVVHDYDLEFDWKPVPNREQINKAIIRENAAAQACAMEQKTFGDIKFTLDEYKEARTHRLALEAN